MTRISTNTLRIGARAALLAALVWLLAPAGVEAAGASGPGGGGPGGGGSGGEPGATAKAEQEPAAAPPAAVRAPDLRGRDAGTPRPEASTRVVGLDAPRRPGRNAAAPRPEASTAFARPAFAAARTSRTAQPAPDFSFGRPSFSIGFHGLLQRPRAQGDFHVFVHENFFARSSPTDDPNDPADGLMDFGATGIGLDVGFAAGARLEARVGLDYATTRAETEERNYDDEFGNPIEQTTELSQWGVHGELAFALAPRGRAIGQYVWIPSAVVPYVGAGGGLVRYRALMNGRFVDVVDYTIFSDTIRSQGWTPSFHVFGGVDFRLTRHVLLTTEARYAWAKAELGGALAGFDHDLAGLRISAGVRFVF